MKRYFLYVYSQSNNNSGSTTSSVKIYNDTINDEIKDENNVEESIFHLNDIDDKEKCYIFAVT